MNPNSIQVGKISISKGQSDTDINNFSHVKNCIGHACKEDIEEDNSVSDDDQPEKDETPNNISPPHQTVIGGGMHYKVNPKILKGIL